jgi:hypothetical protein
VVQRSRRAFDGYLSVLRDLKILLNRDKKPLQLCYIEYRGRAATQIDGIEHGLEMAAHLFGGMRSIGDIGA